MQISCHNMCVYIQIHRVRAHVLHGSANIKYRICIHNIYIYIIYIYILRFFADYKSAMIHYTRTGIVKLAY